MDQLPRQSEDQIRLQQLRAEAGLKVRYTAPEEDPKKVERERKRFEKEHPELFDDGSETVGTAISINGETIESESKQKKRRIARWYSFLHWLRSWKWAIAGIVLLCVLFLPVPIRIDKTLSYYESHHGEAQTGTIHIKGTLYHYFVKRDHFRGRIYKEDADITLKGQSDDAGVSRWYCMMIDTCEGEGSRDFLAFFDDQRWDQIYFDRLFSKLYLYGGTSDFLAAPASALEEAERLKKSANPYWE
ncbi:MAG: hypothetical protein K6A77_13305 [Clostridiales bacterium]|nr:hypothetical protein [Clostridiales bacterium]